MTPPAAPALREWTVAARCEPRVRVGVILAQDRAAAVRVTLPPISCRLVSDPPIAAAPRQTLLVRSAGDRLEVRIDDHAARRVRMCRLETPCVADDPAVGVVVHDVVAGRGFHWQKRIDQTLPGAVEFRADPAGVIAINELPLETYLAGVITAEMSGDCPAELLAAQCVVARSWLLAMSEPKHAGQPFDRCNDDCCQRYQGLAALTPAARAAVAHTRGEVLLADEPQAHADSPAQVNPPHSSSEPRALARADSPAQINPPHSSNEPRALARADSPAQARPRPRILDANYSKSCGGISELPRYVWGIDKPGLSAVVDAPPDDAIHRFFPVTADNLDPYLSGDWLRSTRCYCSPNVVPPDAIGRYLGRVDEARDYFRWTIHYAAGELEQLLREKLADAANLVHVRDLRVIERGVSGRAVRVAIDWQDAAGRPRTTTLDSEYRIREVLHRRFLFSSAIVFHVKHACAGRVERVTIRGAGWGHGAGMCQIGALGMALTGRDYRAICAHYYPAAQLATVYE